MTRMTLGISVLTIAALLSACAAPTSTPVPTSTPAPTSTSAPTSPKQQATAATSLDPCQLITSAEASKLAGGSFGAGEESTTSGGGKICTYGANTKNVFMVEVGQAPDVATAKAYQADFLATIQENLAQLTSEGLVPTDVPNLGDAAIYAEASFTLPTGTLNGSAIGVRKGTIFFGYSDLVADGPAPTRAAMESEAKTVLGKLP
ncbi:MAG: DUF3558 family protein [Anaerolineales bacterium]